MNAIDLIRAERERQVAEEGWASEHDDSHTDGALALAASAYADPDREMTEREWESMAGRLSRAVEPVRWPKPRWPWRPTPDDRVRELVKAGALIAAEIERLQRASLSTAPGAVDRPRDAHGATRTRHKHNGP